MSEPPKGRPLPAIIRENFDFLEKKVDKSNRSIFVCKHCTVNGTPTGNGARIEHRDNKLIKHLISYDDCPNCPQEVRTRARVSLASKIGPGIAVPGTEIGAPQPTAPAAVAEAPTISTSKVTAAKKRKTLDGYVDYPLTEVEQTRANATLFRWMVYQNIAFRSPENHYFKQFCNVLRPSYTPPSRYVLSHDILDAESARVQIEDLERVKDRKRLTYLTDGWKDALKRELYGCLVAEVNQHPVVLALEDITGARATSANIFGVSQKALKKMGLEDGRNLIAATTDNPSYMQGFRSLFQSQYYWVLLFACFLHGLGNMIGDMCTYPAIKRIVTQTTRIVTFFNSSHYWGGQLNEEAIKQKINRVMKQNCDSRWYALVLQGISVINYRNPLTIICLRPDAQKKIAGLSPVAADVITTVLHTPNYWSLLQQLVTTAKPIVDAIGNLETRQATLADCMLEAIRCAKAFADLDFDSTDPDIDVGFWIYAKEVFNKRFHAMNTAVHSLALFLHPSCRKLAISQCAHGRSLEFMIKTALEIAKQWRWDAKRAHALVEDIKRYHQCKAPFTGGQADGLDWWESLTVQIDEHPLITLAVVLFSVVPHSAEVERHFSALGGVQSARRCNLSVETFETLGKLKANYTYHAEEAARKEGRPIRRRHAHMHTRENPGINLDLSKDLENWSSPLAASDPSDPAVVTDDFTIEELEDAFARVDLVDEANCRGAEVLAGRVYDFRELEKVQRGIVPAAANHVISVTDGTVEGASGWDITQLMQSQGVSIS